MIVAAFLRWIETARTQDRARAAAALAKAYIGGRMRPEEKQAAQIGMTYLLDDPAPQVRLALSEALAREACAPRAIMMSLAEDQMEIACPVILFSPVLTDGDLVDIAGRGTTETRALVASRGNVSVSVAAALAEIGDAAEIEVLLENPAAHFTARTLKRIADRHGRDQGVRARLLDRADLSAETRQLLVQSVAEALIGSNLVLGAIGERRLERIAREASDAASIALLSEVHGEELNRLVEHLQTVGRLTPAFLMHSLCAGRTDFFSAALSAISGMDERRVRSILATGRFHAVRALIEATGIARDVSAIFVEAIVQWREIFQAPADYHLENIAHRIVGKFRLSSDLSDAGAALLDLVERLAIAEERRLARDYASGIALAAA